MAKIAPMTIAYQKINKDNQFNQYVIKMGSPEWRRTVVPSPK
jgi:hypothetical protein